MPTVLIRLPGEPARGRARWGARVSRLLRREDHLFVEYFRPKPTQPTPDWVQHEA